MSVIAERKWNTWLFCPFAFIAGGQALAWGLVAILMAGLIAYAGGTQFNGVLDAQNGRTLSLAGSLLEGFSDWLCLAVTVALTGKVASRTSFRLLDVLGTQALARGPTVFVALLTLPPAFNSYSRTLLAHLTSDPLVPPPINSSAVYFLVASLLMLPFLIWEIVLMYQAYAVSCNVRGWKAVLSFVSALILAEILSKLALLALQ
jgi:hypothetical protein